MHQLKEENTMETKITSIIKKIAMGVVASAYLVSGSYADSIQNIENDMEQMQI